MESFLANLKVILPVVGLDLLKPKPTAVLKPATQLSSGEVRFEIRHRSGIRATAVEEDGEFVVLEGSQALKDAGYQSNQYGEVNDHRLKAVASAYGLKPDWVGPGGRLASWLDDFEVVVRYLGLLILNIFLPHLVRHVAARRHPIAPTPEMLTQYRLQSD